MAETKSTQITNEDATPKVINPTGAIPHWITWDYTVAGAALATTDTVVLCKVPAGCKVLIGPSYFHVNATQGASTHIDIGYKAYKKVDGTTEALDADGIVNGRDGAIVTCTSLGADVAGAKTVSGVVDFSDAVEDVTIYMTALDAGGTYDGDIGDVFGGYFCCIK